MRSVWILRVLCMLAAPGSASAGDVKIKKGIVSVLDQPVFEYEGAMRIEGSTAMVQSATTHEPLFTLRYVTNDSDGRFVFDVKFVGGDGVPRRFDALSFKDFFKQAHKAGVVNAEGHLDAAKADEFGKLFGRPVPVGVSFSPQ